MPTAHGKTQIERWVLRQYDFKDRVLWSRSCLLTDRMVLHLACGLIFLFFHNCILNSFVFCGAIVDNKDLELFNPFLL